MATEAMDMATIELDQNALRAKYAEERDKRLNPRKDGQWTRIEADFAYLENDPYVEPGFTRDAVVEETEVVIVGGGFGGLLSSARLREAGIENFRIIEKAGDFGGTWYWNRYPGVQCDVESYIYLPLLEETGYMPKEKYSYGPEILEHAQRVGRHFGLYDRALFQTQILEMRWSEDDCRWTVTTDRGDTIKARHVISASGPLNRPQLPGVPGIDRFKGKIFHTSRWDFDYTGGNSSGGLTKLADKRVAVVGTGATAIQSVPFTAEYAKQLYVVQRTPSVVGLRRNKPTDPEWVKSLTPGWQKRRGDNFELIIEGRPQPENLVDDGWTWLNAALSPTIPIDELSPQELEQHLELVDFKAGEELRQRVADLVKDPATAESLKAWYRVYCKRPTFNDEYLPAFNRPNVELIDTQGKGVERFTEKGFVCNGVEYEVDCVIFATGFETGTEYTQRSEFEVYGVGGKTLTEHHHDGPRTFHGFYSHGFPNFFILGISQNGFKGNFTQMLWEQSHHIVGLIAEMKKRGLNRLEPTGEAETEWQAVIRAKAKDRVSFLTNCTPGYYNGQTDVDRGLLVNIYGGGQAEFTELLDAWHARGDWAGLAAS